MSLGTGFGLYGLNPFLFFLFFLSVDGNVAKSASRRCCHDAFMPSPFRMDSILVELWTKISPFLWLLLLGQSIIATESNYDIIYSRCHTKLYETLFDTQRASWGQRTLVTQNT